MPCLLRQERWVFVNSVRGGRCRWAGRPARHDDVAGSASTDMREIADETAVWMRRRRSLPGIRMCRQHSGGLVVATDSERNGLRVGDVASARTRSQLAGWDAASISGVVSQ